MTISAASTKKTAKTSPASRKGITKKTPGQVARTAEAEAVGALFYVRRGLINARAEAVLEAVRAINILAPEPVSVGPLRRRLIALTHGSLSDAEIEVPMGLFERLDAEDLGDFDWDYFDPNRDTTMAPVRAVAKLYGADLYEFAADAWDEMEKSISLVGPAFCKAA